ncbi:CBS domain-containing protein [Methanophagales archaeon]|nr:CBS domain-containing protein [Methanophagales archaeon]
MKVKDVMSSPVITEDEDTSVTIVARDMELSEIGSVVITREDKPVGIVTDRDISIKICAKMGTPGEVTVKGIMTAPLITIGPEAPVEKACELLAENDIRRLPVMENDKLVGIISVRNILTGAPEHVQRFYPAEGELVSERLEVGDVMTREVITEDEDTIVSKISKTMEESGIGGVVILKGGKPVGMVSDGDIASKVIMNDKNASEIKAKEIMCSPLVSIGPDAPVEKACGIMAAKEIRRMPVMDEDKLVGIISVRNILTRSPGHVHKFYPGE